MKKKKRKSMWNRLSGIMLVAMFFIGLSVLLYPTIADFWNQQHQTRAIASYEETVSTMTEDDTEAMLAEAEAYNASLLGLSSPLLEADEIGDYEDILDITDTGIMGYITIDRINVELPIYHGTSEGVLQIACGHLEGTSLPVGGTSTHAVLSAHRGLPSAKLFTDLDEMEVGDTFVITVLNRTLTYEVDQIKIVLPQETEELQIVEGEDYCTLLTCTPYGLNTHRLLVRGTRIENAREAVYVTTDAYQIDSLLAAPAVAAPILLVLLIYLLVRYNKKNAKRIRIEEVEYEEPEDD